MSWRHDAGKACLDEENPIGLFIAAGLERVPQFQFQHAAEEYDDRCAARIGGDLPEWSTGALLID
jgi:hypothetical protein